MKIWLVAALAILVGCLALALACGASSSSSTKQPATDDDDDDDVSPTDDDNDDDGSPADDDDDASPADDDDDLSPGPTWTDSVSGLTWQVTPRSDKMVWADAKKYCGELNGNGQTGWHLPTISELRTLIRGCPATQTGGACEVTDKCLGVPCWTDDCNGCTGSGPGPNGCFWPTELSGFCAGYWASTQPGSYGQDAWGASYDSAYVFYDNTLAVYSVRCVR